MTRFNRMTIVAALQVVEDFHSHSDLEAIEVEWGIHGRCRTGSKSAHITDLANIAINEDPEVLTVSGKTKMSRAIVEMALEASPDFKSGDAWNKFLAGLRFDGFEVWEEPIEKKRPWEPAKSRSRIRRMMPDSVNGLDFREAESEINRLLSSTGMSTPKGHLDQAISAFSRGDWASANGQLRTFYETYLDEIAVSFGCNEKLTSKEKRDFLGNLNPPFLLEYLNEWNQNIQKPQYIQGLMSRMHPHGSHAGLSDEDDATFRLQITLITARLLLRRFNNFKKPGGPMSNLSAPTRKPWFPRNP